jgi:hypothetical protein
VSKYKFDGKELYEDGKALSKAMAGIRLNEQQKKVDALEKKLAEAFWKRERDYPSKKEEKGGTK